MKNIALRSVALVTGLTMLLSVVGVSLAMADNGNNSDNEGGHQQEKEAAMVGSTLEIHVSNNGNVLVRGAKVTGVSGTTVNASTMWGSATLNWTVNTDTNTQFIRRFGGQSSVSEISVGDFISFKGMVVTTASAFTVNAQILKDWSVQKQNATFNGTVQSVGTNQFVLASRERGNITVNVSGTTAIKKGDATAVFADITVSANVTVSGVWDTQASTLAADRVLIRVPKPANSDNSENKMTIEGTVQSMTTSTTPGTVGTMILTVGNNENTQHAAVNYTVTISSDTSILNNLWLKLAIGNIKVGDRVRVYGAVTGTNVNATVVRDTSIRL